MARRSGRDPGDFGENFVEKERQFRFRKNNALSSRAKSEVGEVLGYKSGGRSRDYIPNVPLDTSFQSDVPVYRRPKSSFEPASSSRVLKNRSDDWCEVERRVIGNISSDDEGNSDRDDDDSREEMLSYNFRPIESARHSNSYGHQQHHHGRSGYGYHRNGGRKSLMDFDKDEIYFFGSIQLSPEKAYQILSKNPPPIEYRQLKAIERAAYLYYFMLYRKYLTPVEAFRRVFNREFYKYVCDGDREDAALWKICKHTHEEYKRKIQKRNQEVYSQKHLFSDEHDSPDSRNSERQSVCDQESDLNSVESVSKEPYFYRVPHSTVSFAVGGKMVISGYPDNSVSTVNIEDAKNFFLDRANQRHVEALESFKGPLSKTRPQTALLFIERQIERIRQSDVYRGNPTSGDANDCLLIWHLLEVLVRQQGKVTGPDLARLLVADFSYSSFTAQNFVRGSSDRVYESAGSFKDVSMKNEQDVNLHAMDKFTQYLLGGHVEEAVESAMHDGLLFDALFLAHRIYKNDPRKLSEVEEKLLRYRKPQHPVMTLMSVAAEMAVPLLTNTTTDDASGWRAHIAIVLANLQSPAAIETVYQLGLALAQKEFNSAADFCFLAVNLLNGSDCFRDPENASGKNVEGHRRHITLINASLPDDEFHSTHTRFGWSILDYQATEIFDYAQRLAYGSTGVDGAQMPATSLSRSVEFQKCRLQYAKLLGEYGGFNSNVFQYCTDIACSIWGYATELEPAFLAELCELADRFKYVANCDDQQCAWISCLQQFIPSAQAAAWTKDSMAAVNATPTTPIATTFSEREGRASMVSSDTADFNTATDQTTSDNALNVGLHGGGTVANNKIAAAVPTPSSPVFGEQNSPPPTSQSVEQTSSVGIQPRDFAKNSVIQPVQHYQFKEQHNDLDHQQQIYRQRQFEMDQQHQKDQQHQTQRRQQSQHQPMNFQQPSESHRQPPASIQHHSFDSHQQHHRQSVEHRLSTSSSRGGGESPFYAETPAANVITEPPLADSNDAEVAPINFSNFYTPDYNDSNFTLESPVPPPINAEMQSMSFQQNNTVGRFSPSPLDGGDSHHIPSNNQTAADGSFAQQQDGSDGGKSKDDNLMGNDSKSSGGGLFSGLKNRLVKIIPTNSTMNLPDDKNPEIRWDEKLGRYVGDGVEDDYVPPPPPAMMAMGGGGSGFPPMNSPAMPPQFGGGFPPIPEGVNNGTSSSTFSAKKKAVGGRALQKRYCNPGHF